MSLFTAAVRGFQENVDELPPEVVDELPDDVIRQLRDGVIDQIPEDVVDGLSDSARDLLIDQAPDFVPASVLDAVSNNPLLAVALALIGVVAVVGFFWGVTKSAFKAMLFFGVAGAAAWYFFAQSL